METQVLSKRYVSKQHLFRKLDELFPDGNYEVEVWSLSVHRNVHKARPNLLA